MGAALQLMGASPSQQSHGGSSIDNSVKLPSRKRPANLDLVAMRRFDLPTLHAEAAAARTALQHRSRSRLRVVTWNVWFDDLCKSERMAALLREVFSMAPDVACLQEVLPELAQALRACGWLTDVYDISPFDVGAYGCMMLVRKDLQAEFVEVPLTTLMDRNLVLATCKAGLPGLSFATTHLESLNSEKVRRRQLEEAAQALRNKPCAILCGDFNFDATQTYGDWRLSAPARKPEDLENRVLQEVLPAFVDVWPAVNTEVGYTFDGLVNPRCCHDVDERMRYDRIMVRGSVAPFAASLLGTKAINHSGIMPSDHFGVMADFDIAQ